MILAQIHTHTHTHAPAVIRVPGQVNRATSPIPLPQARVIHNNFVMETSASKNPAIDVHIERFICDINSPFSITEHIRG